MINVKAGSVLSKGMAKGIAFLGACGLLWLTGLQQAWAEEALCAEVKIEILQELTMERQGFEALMRITNSLDSFSLEDVSISVHFADADGNPVVATSNTAASDAAFFIRVDDTKDVTGLQMPGDGKVEGGVIAPKKVGEVRWLIIPTANAAGNLKDGRLYFVGAQLSYSYGGKEETVDVAPDSIVVKPQPALTLDYFLTEHIVGDDAFTPAIEPPEPYTLGVRISNTGYGYADSVKIESAQPTIVENELGLAVDFKILSSYVSDQPAAPTLLIDFGDIEPQGIIAGRWVMQTNLAGRFTAFTASFTHADELGGELTSLLQGTNAHFLVRDVLVTLPGRDGVRDFLAYNPHHELFVYESENTGLNDPLCVSCAAVEEASATVVDQGSTSALTHEPKAGFSYAQVSDPYKGTQVLSRVIRSDGKQLNPRNAWLSKQRSSDGKSFDYFINVFDNASTGSYTLYWGGNVDDVPQPPVIQHIADWTTHEGGSLGFLVQTSDPNGTVPTLSVKQAPTGAVLSNAESGTGVFQWNPTVGQAGSYRVTFVASDGELTTERSVNIKVNPEYDTDGDGMDDAWEMEKFGNLDRDGTGDFDGDGRTDLQEFQEGTDPQIAEVVPGTPQIQSPVYNADVLNGVASPWLPTLAVTNGTHGAGITSVELIFEVYSDEGLTDLVATATVDEGTVADGNGKSMTSVQLTQEHLQDDAAFADNSLYYWRVRARDKTNTAISSSWVKSQFFINSENDAPLAPALLSPELYGVVAETGPTLIISNTTDVDRDRIYYSFALFNENDTDTPLAEVTGLLPGSKGQTRWRIPKVLQEDAGYLWKATATDEHGLATDSAWGMFIVSTDNHAPSKPSILSPAVDGVVTELNNGQVSLSVNNGVDPERLPLTYYFELDSVSSFDSANLQASGAVEEGAERTAWLVSNLKENTSYFWRVKASDGELSSIWVSGQFLVDAINEAPAAPTLNNPVDGSVVTGLKPLFDINPSVDPEGDAITYRFQLFADAALSSPIAELSTSATQWPLDMPLAHGSMYYWRARAEDDKGLAGEWSATRSFTVIDPNYNEPPSFNFVLPDADVVVERNEGLLLQWVDSDADSSATISLFYTDAAGTRTLIARGLSEDADGTDDQYLWSTQDIPAGVYQLSAVVGDEDNEVTVELCCTVTVPEKVIKTLTATITEPFSTNEQGTVDATVQVALSHALEGDDTLTLNFAVSNPNEVQVMGDNYLMFDSANWNQPQTIRLRGVDDCEIDGSQSFEVTFEPAVSSDTRYHGFTLDAVAGINEDNETVDQIWFICDYELVNQAPVDTGLVDYTYRARLRNAGEVLPGAEAFVTVLPAVNGSTQQVVPSEGKLEFPAVAQGGTAWSSNTFVIRHLAREEADFAKLRWTITPAETGSGKCELKDENAGSYTAWDASVAFDEGQFVSFDNLVWKANWWNQNSAPLTVAGAWDLISEVEFPWHSSLAYEAGDEVNYNDRRWKARWPTQGEVPGSGPAWEDIGFNSCVDVPIPEPVDPEPTECDLIDPNAGNHPVWSVSQTYDTGQRVSYQNLVWEAKWWNSAITPDSMNTPWRLISEVEYPWTPAFAYETGDEVNHADQRWRANWEVNGEEPGQGQAWTLIGESSCL